jgi:hypothetical protein
MVSTANTVVGASMEMESAGGVMTEATTVADAGVMETVAPATGVVVAEAAAEGAAAGAPTAGAGGGAAEVAAAGTGPVAGTTEAAVEGADMRALDAANRRLSHSLCSAKSFRISSRRNWVEGEISDGESMVLWVKLGAKIDGSDTRC